MTEKNCPEVPEGVIEGIEDILRGNTATKEELEEAFQNTDE